MSLISFFCCEKGVKKRKGDVLVNYHQGCYSNSFKDCLVGLLGAIESSSDCSVVFHSLLVQAGQGCLVPVNSASHASITTVTPAMPALGAGKVQGKEGTQSQISSLNFSLQAHREFQGSTFTHLLLLFSPPFITLTHFPVGSQREAPDKAAGASQAPRAAPHLGG